MGRIVLASSAAGPSPSSSLFESNSNEPIGDSELTNIRSIVLVAEATPFSSMDVIVKDNSFNALVFVFINCPPASISMEVVWSVVNLTECPFLNFHSKTPSASRGARVTNSFFCISSDASVCANEFETGKTNPISSKKSKYMRKSEIDIEILIWKIFKWSLEKNPPWNF